MSASPLIVPLHRVSFSVETPSFVAAGTDFIWEGCNPFQIRATHRVTLYVSSCVLKHIGRV
ncbi:hypothetical protein EZZ75_03235 [Neisseria meningitidis]|nr:hypothetical protein [Neisseria meningitidis]